ncbi:MAG: response regulator [Proteobacteria bacterium]|nr:response regulator [Pseudomonadota bacterium]MBU1710707.1 response regulator [Pseudomonadota bacterium]
MEAIRVLLVDDEKEFVVTLAERLRLRGFDTTPVVCAEDVFALIRSEGSPDVVLLDLKMPDMDGMDVLANIKLFDPSIEVIMLTGHGGDPEGVGAKKGGAFEYIMKPIDIAELMVKINQAAAQRRRGLSGS